MADGWTALSVANVEDLLRDMRGTWWLAGGWALDMHLGRRSRAHDDIDVRVLRRDLHAIRERLAGWDLHGADPPGTLREWRSGETLPESVHDIWCRPQPTSPWALQIMVDDAAGEDWVYRRDPRIRRPVSTLAGPASTKSVPVLAPDVTPEHSWLAAL